MPEQLAAGRAARAAATPDPAPDPAEPGAGATRKHQRAQAAAFKALYVATGRFTAGISEERLKADIFDRAPMGQIANTMPAVTDEQAKTVSVAYADDMPPRIAAWRPVLGSTQLPIGATAVPAGQLPAAADR